MFRGPIARRFTIFALGLTLAGCGCSESERVAVQGNVTLDGKPLVRGAIVFVPTGGTAGPKAGAVIDNGHFSIDARQGPLAGKLHLRITTDRPPDYLGPYDKTSAGQPAVRIPARYNAGTTLIVEATREGPNHFDFKLQSQEAR